MTVDHWENTFRAMSKAMNELVLPALDPSDQLVFEQAGLVAKFLEHMSTRLPWYHERNRVELIDAVRLAEGVEAATYSLDEELGRALTEVLESARDLLDDPAASVSQLQDRSARLSGAVSVAVRRAGESDVDDAVRVTIERSVVRNSLPSIEMQRAWFLDQGWEPDPDSVPSLEEALRR